LLDYLELTQAGDPVRLSPPRRRAASGYMAIDPATRHSLEIERTQQGRKQGSLLSVIDKTITGPGARTLSYCLARPLIDVQAIKARLDAVDGGPRDILTLGASLYAGEEISALFNPNQTLPGNITQILDSLSLAQKPEIAKLARDISKAFKKDVPMLARDGGFIAPGWDAALDDLRKLRDEGRRIIAGLQADYARQTDIPSLKIKHNNVLGYFIEVTPTFRT